MRPRTIATAAAFTLLLLLPQLAAAQQPANPSPPARPADVESVDAILTALYDVISGPQGQARDWDRMRSLFVPGARLMPLNRRADGTFVLANLSVEDYIQRAGPQLVASGFTERELARTTEQYGNMVHAFSTYHGEMAATGNEIRGINSIQLMNDGSRWWVVTVFWEAERPDNPLPEKYLPREGGGTR
jgi:hypothetical protein